MADHAPTDRLSSSPFELHLAPVKELPGSPVGDVEPPLSQGTESPLEPRHSIGEERLAIDGSPSGNLQTRRRCRQGRIKFRHVAAHIQPKANN